MPVADRIRKVGFRRWHERQLIEAHASLVTAFLCVIVIAVGLDQLQLRDAGFKPLLMVLLIAAGVVLCFKTVTLYFKVLFRAEHFAEQAVCAACKAYGAIEVMAASSKAPQELSAAAGDVWLDVRCKKCRHEWRMSGVESAELDGNHR